MRQNPLICSVQKYKGLRELQCIGKTRQLFCVIIETTEAAPLQAAAETGILVLLVPLIVRKPDLQRASMHTEVFLMPVLLPWYGIYCIKIEVHVYSD